MRTLLIILSLSLFVGCVNQRSVGRWIKNNGGLVHVDSSFVVDTLKYITNKVETDTVFSIFRTDTMVIRKDNLTVKTYIYKDSIYVYGKCDTDTVTIIQERWVGNTLTIDEKRNWFEKNWLILCLFSVLILIAITKK